LIYHPFFYSQTITTGDTTDEQQKLDLRIGNDISVISSSSRFIETAP